MRKKILGVVASLALAMGLAATGGVPAAQACPVINPQAQTYATGSGSYKADAAQAQITMNGPALPYDSNWEDHSTWVGVQDDVTGYLVQGGYSISGFSSTRYYAFFYEFAGPGQTGAVDITSQVSYSGTWTPTHKILFHIWYHDVNGWGFEIVDMDANAYVMYSQYIHPTSAVADQYIGHTAIVATEPACYDDNYNNATITIKQPAFHLRSSGTWYLFEDMSVWGYGNQYAANLNRNGNLDESATTANSNGYAYQVWHNFN